MFLSIQQPHSVSHLRHWHGLLICFMALVSPLTWALDSDRQQPLEINADSAELNEGEGFSVYSGNVVITQGSMKIEASTVTITFDDSGIQTMLATEEEDGLAYMRQQAEPTGDGKSSLMEAWGKSIDYQVTKEYLTLLGSAKLSQRGNQFSGNKILFDVPKDNVKASGGEDKRVKMIFLPKSN
jgi:lipopolysaccharide export system protein LptA